MYWFLKEAFDRDDRKMLVVAFERSDYAEGNVIKKMIKELDIKHGRDLNPNSFYNS